LKTISALYVFGHRIVENCAERASIVAGGPFIGTSGLGYADIFSSDGQLLQRLEHGDWLNAPWGVALALLDFGIFSHDLLVGKFAGAGSSEGSGTIAVYDLATGKFIGLVQDASGKPLSINGLWALSPAIAPHKKATIPPPHPRQNSISAPGQIAVLVGSSATSNPLPLS
jgi:hypothetical protein